MLRERTGTYVWVTWVAKLLAGTSQCQWAVWFMAHYQDYQTVETGFDLLAYKFKHQEALRRRREELEAQGYIVFSEDQNWFKLVGKKAVLAGKPDLVWFADPNDLSHGVCEDIKTGQRRDSDFAQVALYQYALPLSKYPGSTFEGRLTYADSSVELTSAAIDDEFKDTVRSLMSLIAADSPPTIVPSERECAWCKITAADCPQRVEPVGNNGDFHTEDF